MPGTISVDTKTQTYDGNAQPTPRLCLLHTTEGMGWPPYAGGGEAPHITVQPLPGKGIHVRVHRPWTDYGKALANRPGGVETNRAGVIQIELMGTCSPASRGRMYFWPEADDAVLSALAEYLRPVLARFDIPAKAVAPFLPYPKSYGSKGGQRLSNAAWNKARGICGHQHAPENDHGDPGAFPIARFIQFITQEDDMPDPAELWTAKLSTTGTILGPGPRGAAEELESPLVILTRMARNVEALVALEKAQPQAAQIAAAVVAAQGAAGQPDVDVDALAKAIVVQIVKAAEETEGGAQ